MSSSGKSVHAYFLATPTTLLPVCQPVAAVTEINTTVIESQGVWECPGSSRIVPGMISKGEDVVP